MNKCDSTSDYVEVNKSALNRSKAKMLYTFGKAPRFKELYESSGSDVAFYDLPSVFSHRSASIGKGQRYDFTQGAKSQSPYIYSPPGIFDKKPKYGIGKSFGAGREAFLQIGKILIIIF